MVQLSSSARFLNSKVYLMRKLPKFKLDWENHNCLIIRRGPFYTWFYNNFETIKRKELNNIAQIIKDEFKQMELPEKLEGYRTYTDKYNKFKN